MTQQEIDKQASISLLDRAVHSDSITIAYLLIESAHRLDNTISVKEYKERVTNNWQTAEHNKRKDIIK